MLIKKLFKFLREQGLLIISLSVAAFCLFVFLKIYPEASANNKPALTSGIFMLLVVFVTTLQAAFKDASDRAAILEKRRQSLWDDRLEAYRSFGKMLYWFDQNNQNTYSFWSTRPTLKRTGDLDFTESVYHDIKNKIFADASKTLDTVSFLFEKDMVIYLTNLYEEMHKVQRECEPTNPESLSKSRMLIIKFNEEHLSGRHDSPFAKRFKKYLDRND